MPRALVLGVSIVTVVYIAVSVAFLYLVAAGSRSTRDKAFAALAGRALFGRTGEVVFAAGVVASVAGSLAAVLMAFPRVYYAMARDGLFFPSIAAVNPRRGTPMRAIAIQAALAIVLALTGTFEQILDYFMVPTLAFLAMALAGIFVLHRRSHRLSMAPLNVPGYPVTVLLALVPILIVIVLQTLRDPLRTSRSGWPSSFSEYPSRHGSCHGDSRRRAGQLVPTAIGQLHPHQLTLSRIAEREPRFPLMAWIRTTPLEGEDDAVLEAMADQRLLYPQEYAQPVQELDQGLPGIVASHSLIPQALYHAFATFGVVDVARPAASSAGSTR